LPARDLDGDQIGCRVNPRACAGRLHRWRATRVDGELRARRRAQIFRRGPFRCKHRIGHWEAPLELISEEVCPRPRRRPDRVNPRACAGLLHRCRATRVDGESWARRRGQIFRRGPFRCKHRIMHRKAPPVLISEYGCPLTGPRPRRRPGRMRIDRVRAFLDQRGLSRFPVSDDWQLFLCPPRAQAG